MNVDLTTSAYYRVGGNLPPNAPSYVKREADEQLYKKLKDGEFCYVLNSRQMGKSSLWVRVKQRLEKENYICAAIDLSGIGQGQLEQWYTSFANRLTKGFNSSVKKQWRRWWKENNDLSPVERLHQLIEELLLPSLLEHQKIIVFIDEIDYVKGLPFSTDEFFALIRSCFNDRSINPKYNQITFCLLGVATPGALIENKNLTPFNIGTGIELKGFRLEEVESLIKGLEGNVIYPESVMSDILYWTGGQPFLTQRLCSLVVKEKNPTPDVSQIVQRMIIDNWEAQDKQEHLRTIKNRILSNEQRAGYLLDLYRKVLLNEQVPINNSSEETELQLSGLVVKKGNIIQVYNPIYAKVFDETWIDAELNKLRPYSENYRAWLQSGKTDESRLLRGKALVEAEKWASGKNVGGEDRDFLGASRAAEREEESERNAKQILEEANIKYRKRIRIGSMILGVSLLGATICGVWAIREGIEATNLKNEVETVKELTDLAGVLQDKGLSKEYDEALKQAGLSFQVKDRHHLKQALLYAARAAAHDALKQTEEAKQNIEKSRQYLESVSSSDEVAQQIRVLIYTTEAQLNNQDNNKEVSLNLYQQAFETLRKSGYDPYDSPLKILSEGMVASIHLRLRERLKNESDAKIVETSLKEHYKKRTQQYINQLEGFLKNKQWKKADGITWDAIFYSAKAKNLRSVWEWEEWKDTSCSDFAAIETLWYNHSDGQFSFKEQWKIYSKLNNYSPEYDFDAYLAFSKAVGWYSKEQGWKSYKDLNWSENLPQISKKGHLPRGRAQIMGERDMSGSGVHRGIENLDVDNWLEIVGNLLQELGIRVEETVVEAKVAQSMKIVELEKIKRMQKSLARAKIGILLSHNCL